MPVTRLKIDIRPYSNASNKSRKNNNRDHERLAAGGGSNRGVMSNVRNLRGDLLSSGTGCRKGPENSDEEH